MRGLVRPPQVRSFANKILVFQPAIGVHGGGGSFSFAPSVSPLSYNPMATDMDTEEQLMIAKSYPELKQIDPERARFPCCVVWTPLPLLSWLIPFIGHVGICREDGVILDFAGPNFISVDNFAFGSVTRYLQIDEKLCRAICLRNREPQDSSGSEEEILRWDDAVRTSTQEYQHRSYSLLTCNCHSFVANNLNRLGFGGRGWNVVNVAVLMLLKGHWVNRAAILKSFLPFVVVFLWVLPLEAGLF